MVGVWLAAEKYSRLDFPALDRQCEGQANYVAAELKKIPGMEVGFAPHDRTRHVWRVRVQWDEQALRLSHDECEKLLLEGEPRIAVLRHGKALVFTMFMNDPGDEKLVARRMKEIFTRKG
jgi:L-seryl-tRNA(Ser) seleniumtransferase